jgi:hypothetical protein
MPYHRLSFLEQRRAAVVFVVDPSPDPPGALAIDQPQIRIDFFAVKTAQVQAQIQAFEQERTDLLKAIETVHKFFALEAGPIQAQIQELEQVLHTLFATAQTIPKGLKSQQRVAKVYASLHGKLLRPKSPDPIEVEDLPEAMDEQAPADSPNQQDCNHQYIPMTEVTSPPLDSRSNVQLRKLYLKLCELFHPDKHPGSAAHAAIMVQINDAYSKSDLNRLLQIESGQGGRVAAADDAIERYRAIVDQLNATYRAVQILRHQEEVEIMLQIATGRSNPFQDLIAGLTNQLEGLTKLEQLLNPFLAGKLGILKFLEELESMAADFDDDELMD